MTRALQIAFLIVWLALLCLAAPALTAIGQQPVPPQQPPSYQVGQIVVAPAAGWRNDFRRFMGWPPLHVSCVDVPVQQAGCMCPRYYLIPLSPPPPMMGARP